MTKKGLRAFDSRAAVLAARTSRRTTRGRGSTVVLRHTVPAVRPDDVLTGLRQVAGLEVAGRAAGHPARAGSATTRRPARSAIRYPVDSAGIGGPVCDTRGDRNVRLAVATDPTTFLPVRSLEVVRHAESKSSPDRDAAWLSR